MVDAKTTITNQLEKLFSGIVTCMLIINLLSSKSAGELLCLICHIHR